MTEPVNDELAATKDDLEGSCCDCCGKRRLLSRVWAFGIETWACDECRGMVNQ